jgi:predicted amidohydrolase YtcJ
MLIRNARVWPASTRPIPEAALADLPLTDLRLASGRIGECAPGLRPAPGEADMDAAGGTVLPGLHDHHVHLRALAAARASVAAGPPHIRTAAGLAARLRTADTDLPPGTWLRAVGYHESVAGPLDRWVLDRLVPHRPVRVQHRTGALWMVNSAAVARLDLDGCELSGVERDQDGRPTGRLWRMDRWLADRVPALAGDLAAVSTTAAALGITGFTDATPGMTAADLVSLAEAGVAQRLHCMAPADAGPPPGTITLGPVKILLDDATLPPLDDLADRIRAAHAAGRPAAVHCVTRVQLVLTLAALDAAGRLPGDRIEHGAVIPAESLPHLRGLTVVTQPHFVAERGEQYARDVPPEDLPDLWRLRSLADAGVAVAGGTDAPFGGEDVWHVMRAAVRRPPLFRPREAVPPARALSLFLGEPAAPGTQRLVAPGRPADLVLLRAEPREALHSLASDLVAATFAGGTVIYGRRDLPGRAQPQRADRRPLRGRHRPRRGPQRPVEAGELAQFRPPGRLARDLGARQDDGAGKPPPLGDEQQFGRHDREVRVRLVPVRALPQIHLGDRAGPVPLRGVDEHGQLDTVADRDGQRLEQRPAGRPLARQRLGYPGELRPPQVKQRPRDEFRDPPAASLAITEAVVAGLDEQGLTRRVE